MSAMWPPRGTPEWKRWRAAGKFVQQRGQWTWFATLTFRFRVTTKAQTMGRVRGWIDRLAKHVSCPIQCVVAAERFVTGECHAHVLVEFPPVVCVPSTCFGEGLWRAKNGHARVVLFDPTRGGCWYVVKEPDAWDLIYGRPSRHMPRLPLPPATK